MSVCVGVAQKDSPLSTDPYVRLDPMTLRSQPDLTPRVGH